MKQVFNKMKEPYKPNKDKKTCCVCMETTDRIYSCDECKDGVVCVDCYKQVAKLINIENLIILSYCCPICRDFSGVDLDHSSKKQYELDDKLILDKILTFNRENINDYHYRRDMEDSYSSDEDDYNDYDDGFYSREEMINDDLMITLSSVHGLTGEARERQAEKQSREIDVIKNVYYLSDLFITT